MLRARLATTAVAVPTLLAIILYPSPWPVAVLVAIVGVLGVCEYAAMAFPSSLGQRLLTSVTGGLVVVGAAYPLDLRVFIAVLALAVAAGLIWVVFNPAEFSDSLGSLGLSLVGILYVALFLPHFIWLRQVQPLGADWVIFVLVIAMSGDAGGYAVGHLIGRHKLIPRVSPGKTVEGAIGIIVSSLLGGAACKLIFLHVLTWREALLLTAVMATIGQLGDLCESVMKRRCGVKESGWLLPGHGGVLDRIDSLVFPVTFLYYYVVLFR